MPVGGADTVIIEFNEAVDVEEADLVLKGRNLSSSVTTYVNDAFTDNAGGATGPFKAKWDFDSTFAGYTDPGQQMHLKLTSGATAVRDIAGNTLDGEWDNPSDPTGDDIDDATSDTFPSGNGTIGGDFTFSFTILMGDADQDNKIDIDDLNAVRNNFGTGTTWAQGNFDGVDETDISDLNVVRNKFGEEIVDAWDGSEALMASGGPGGSMLSTTSGEAATPLTGEEAMRRALRKANFASLGSREPSEYDRLFGWDLLGGDRWWKDLLDGDD